MRDLEQAQRRRVRDHHGRGPRAEGGPERVDVHAAVGRGRDRDRAEAGHRRGRRVRAVRAVGDEHLVALRVAPRAVVGADHEDPGQLALGARRRLERHRPHAADLGQGLLELPQQLERALGGLVGGERMEVGEARQAGRPLVELRVELHRARAERIEARVDRVVELRQVDVVADDLGLVELRQGRRRDRAARRPGSGRARPPAGAGSCRRPGPGRQRRRGSAGGADR